MFFKQINFQFLLEDIFRLEEFLMYSNPKDSKESTVGETLKASNSEVVIRLNQQVIVE